MDSFQDLKSKYLFHSQKQMERIKKSSRQSRLIDVAEKSNSKLLALKKVLKVKMDAKKKEKYEKRLLMYKIANEEEEADYEKFFDEDENEEGSKLSEKDDGDEHLAEEDNEDNEDDSKSNDKESDLNQDENSRDCTQDTQEESKNELNDKSNDESNDELNEEDDEENSQSMDCTATPNNNLIDENRDLLTKMMNKTQSQMNNEDLLGLCSAKVSSNSFVDDECEEDSEDNMTLDGNEANDESDLDEEENDEDKQNEKESNSSFDIMKARLQRHKELESDSDEEEFSFVNKFKFKKACKIDDSEEEDEENSKLTFKNKFNHASEEQLNSQDTFDNLNSQDSQFENNRESTFLESKNETRKSRFNIKEFIEDQAELSEEDRDKVSSDEDDESNDEYEQEVIDENLPSDDEILKANNRMYMKQQMDEDRRELLEYQERFLEYGDLHDDGEVRQRKFKWKNIDNVWVDNVKDSSDSDEFDIADSQIEFTSLHLKQIDELNKSKEEFQESQSQGGTQSSVSLSNEEKRKKKLMNTSLNKNHLSSYSTFDNNIFSKHMRTFKRTMVNGPANDIKSYIIKDKNLVDAMSVKPNANKAKARQPNRPVDNLAGASKKRKTGDKIENKKSIFDLF